MGQSTCIGIGGDPINGTNYRLFRIIFKDDDTKSIVMIGEIGGMLKKMHASLLKRKIKKPMVGFIAGLTAPLDEEWVMQVQSLRKRRS